MLLSKDYCLEYGLRRVSVSFLCYEIMYSVLLAHNIYEQPARSRAKSSLLNTNQIKNGNLSLDNSALLLRN